MEYNIREMKAFEYPLLDNFLYEAIFQRNEMNCLLLHCVQLRLLKQNDDHTFLRE